jgi:hypothetical protein
MRRILPFVALIAVTIGCSEKPRTELKNPVGKAAGEEVKPAPDQSVPNPNGANQNKKPGE